MSDLAIFELPKEPTRIWDLSVPVVTKGNVTQAFLSSAIEDPSEYNELCYLLRTAEEGTTVMLHLNTPGGIIDSAFMIADAIINSKAQVVARLSGTVASAGTIIAMACDDVETSAHLSFMIHNYSGGMAGKGHEMKARQKFTDDHLNDAFKDCYAGFLNEEEMDKVIEGTDLWMGTAEVAERWEQRKIYLQGE